MNYINVNLPNIIMAKEYHYKVLRYIIKKKLNGTFFKEAAPIPDMKIIQKVNGVNDNVRNFLNKEENLKMILIGDPLELDNIKNKFNSGSNKKSLLKIINYKTWRDNATEKGTYFNYTLYDLAGNLNISTCIYCNRIYTKTVISEKGLKITRPAFDHWFPQGNFPILSMSFFNLIPTCAVCNTDIKKETVFEINQHFHPYYKHPDNNIDFSFSFYLKSKGKHGFKFNCRNLFSRKYIRFFEFKEVYKTHEEELNELIRLKEVYPDRFLTILEKRLSRTKTDKQELYRLAFGTYIDEANFEKRPLSKMKKDILKEIGIVDL